jgi:hypothetical protein
MEKVSDAPHESQGNSRRSLVAAWPPVISLLVVVDMVLLLGGPEPAPAPRRWGVGVRTRC